MDVLAVVQRILGKLALVPNTTIDAFSSATVNDYSPTQLRSIIIVNPTAAGGVTMTGMVAAANSGTIVTLVNQGTVPLILADQSASSSAANRFQLRGDTYVFPNDGIALYYDGQTSRWVGQTDHPPTHSTLASGSALFMVGHSMLTGAGSGHASRSSMALLAGMLRCDLVDIGAGGAQAGYDGAWLNDFTSGTGWQYVLQNAPVFSLGAPYTPQNQIPYVHYGLNDLFNHARDIYGSPRAVFKNSLRTILSRLCSARVFEDSDASITYGGTGGTWQSAVSGGEKSNKLNSGTSYRPVPGNGATFTITLPADFEGGNVAVGTTTWPLSDGSIAWSGTASNTTPVNGTTMGTGPAVLTASANAVGTFDGTTGVTVFVPAGTQNGELLYTVIGGVLPNTANATPTITPPAGWAVVDTGVIASTSAGHDGSRVTVYSRTASSEPASYKWTGNGTTAHGMTGKMYRIVGLAGTPVNVSSNNSGSNSTNVVASSVTPNVTGTVLMSCNVFGSAAAVTFTSDASMIEDADFSTDPGEACSMSVDFAYQSAASATGSKTAVSSAGGAATSWATVMIALAPGNMTTLSGTAYMNGLTGTRRDSSNGVVYRFTGLLASDATKTIIGTYSGGAGTTFATPAQQGALTVNGTVGVTTYGYRRVYLTYNGNTIWSAERTVATGNATLTATNSISIPAGPAFPAGVIAELVIRTTGGANNGGQGLIATMITNGGVTDTGFLPSTYTNATLNPLIGGCAFDYWQIEANNPITYGVCVNLHRVPDGAYKFGSGDSDIANYNADMSAVLNEFAAGQWLLVDLDSAFNKNLSYFPASGTDPHPNSRGHPLYAATVYAAMVPWMEALPLSTIAGHSSVMKRVSSRRQVVQKVYRNASNVFGPDGLAETYFPFNGTIAAGSLPFTGSGTADYSIDAGVSGAPRVIDTAHLDLQIEAEPGDDLEIELAAQVAAGTVALALDIAILDAAGAVIRYLSANQNSPTTVGSGGWPAWFTSASVTWGAPVTGKAYVTIQSGDIITWNTIPGIVRLALVGKTPSSTRVLFGGGSSASPPLALGVHNVSQRNFLYNTS